MPGIQREQKELFPIFFENGMRLSDFQCFGLSFFNNIKYDYI